MNRIWSPRINSVNLDRNNMATTYSQQESVVLAETFEHHWQQLKSITNHVSFYQFKDSECLIKNTRIKKLSHNVEIWQFCHHSDFT